MGENVIMRDLYGDFMRSRRLMDLSAKSVSDYQIFLKPFLVYVDGSSSLDSLTQEKVSDYLDFIVSRPVSRATRATYIRNVKIFLRWIDSEYPVLYDYKKIKVPKSPKRVVRIYSDADVRMVFDSVVSGVPWITLRNRAIIALMYDSGLRQSEICGLLWSNVNFSDRLIRVRGKGDKERIVPLGQYALTYLNMYRDRCPHEIAEVFCDRTGKPLQSNAVKLFVSKLAKKLPFELSSHKLRHNFATNYCIDQYEKYGTIDIYRLMYLMGHDQIETTQKYLHFANEIIASRGAISHLDDIYLDT